MPYFLLGPPPPRLPHPSRFSKGGQQAHRASRRVGTTAHRNQVPWGIFPEGIFGGGAGRPDIRACANLWAFLTFTSTERLLAWCPRFARLFALTWASTHPQFGYWEAETPVKPEARSPEPEAHLPFRLLVHLLNPLLITPFHRTPS